jgi:hypothetical protein
VTDSNVGRWDDWYAELTEPAPYDDVTTYSIGAEWLEPCVTVEDWGTGRGFFKTLRPDAVGIDGSQTPFADTIADLADYRSEVEGIFMRGVIEHDWRWEQILANALASFTRRMCLVLFTADAKEVAQVGWTSELGVPDLSIPSRYVDEMCAGLVADWFSLDTDTTYGVERVWLLER